MSGLAPLHRVPWGLVAPRTGLSLGTDGTDRPLIQTTAVAIPTITSWSIPLWVRRDADSGNYEQLITFGKNDASTDYYALYVEPGDALVAYNSLTESTGPTFAANGIWRHLCITCAGTGASQFLAYVDGALAITHSGSTTPAAGKITVGAAPDGTGFVLRGCVRDVQVFNRVLTASEVQLAMYRPWHPALKRGRINFVTGVDARTPGRAIVGPNMTASASGYSRARAPSVVPWPMVRSARSSAVILSAPSLDSWGSHLESDPAPSRPRSPTSRQACSPPWDPPPPAAAPPPLALSEGHVMRPAQVARARVQAEAMAFGAASIHEQSTILRPAARPPQRLVEPWNGRPLTGLAPAYFDSLHRPERLPSRARWPFAAAEPFAIPGTLRAPAVIVYRLGEAASGQGPTHARDASLSPLDLAFAYSGSTPSYISDAHGRGLNFPSGTLKGPGAFSPSLDIGNEVFDRFDGLKTATIEIAFNLIKAQTATDGVTLNGIAQIFGLTQNDGENDVFMFWYWSTQDALICSFTDTGGYPSAYYRREATLSALSDGYCIAHVVLDTTQPVEANRLKLFINAIPISLHTATSGDGSGAIPLNSAIDVPRPGLSNGFTSGPGLDAIVAMGGWPNPPGYFGGTGTVRGDIYFAAAYDYAFNADEIASAPSRVVDDSDPSQPTTILNLDPMRPRPRVWSRSLWPVSEPWSSRTLATLAPTPVDIAPARAAQQQLRSQLSFDAWSTSVTAALPDEAPARRPPPPAPRLPVEDLGQQRVPAQAAPTFVDDGQARPRLAVAVRPLVEPWSSPAITTLRSWFVESPPRSTQPRGRPEFEPWILIAMAPPLTPSGWNSTPPDMPRKAAIPRGRPDLSGWTFSSLTSLAVSGWEPSAPGRQLPRVQRGDEAPALQRLVLLSGTLPDPYLQRPTTPPRARGDAAWMLTTPAFVLALPDEAPLVVSRRPPPGRLIVEPGELPPLVVVTGVLALPDPVLLRQLAARRLPVAEHWSAPPVVALRTWFEQTPPRTTQPRGRLDTATWTQAAILRLDVFMPEWWAPPAPPLQQARRMVGDFYWSPVVPNVVIVKLVSGPGQSASAEPSPGHQFPTKARR